MKAGTFDEGFGRTLWGPAWPTLNRKVMELLSRAVPVDVWPIAHILTTNKIQPRHNLFPPWRTFYFELSFPENAELRKEATEQGIAPPRSVNKRFPDGVLVHVTEKKDEGWVYEFTSINYVEYSAIQHVASFFVEHDGTIRCNSNNDFLIMMGIPPRQKEMLYSLGFTEEQSKKHLEANVRADLGAVVRFVSFMQARNIKARRKHFPDYQPRKRQHHKIYKYYELTVVKPSITEISQEHGSGIKGKALHSVRGHIRHVTPEKPLFGISGLYGDFFIAQHVRGDIKHGKVEKTYAAHSR
jgi:hypothetical protein